MNPGDRIGDYTIVRSIGTGESGRVYRVRHEITGRIEAMKALPREQSENDELVERFLREARIKAGLNHPNIASLVTAFRHEGRLFMVMEYVEGESLDRKLARGRLARPAALRYASQALAGLSYAHAHGVVHRGIKSENMLIGPGDVLKITDFGLATAGGDGGDVRTDVYAIGAVLYELITGQRPSMEKGVEPAAPEELDPSIPHALSEAIEKAMRKSPEERYASADAFRREIDAVLDGRGGGLTAKPIAGAPANASRGLLAAAGLGVAALAAMWFLSSQPEKDVAAPEADFPAPVASAPIPPTAPAEQPRSEEPVLTATPAPAVVTPKAADEPKQSPKPSPIPAPEAPDAPAADPPRIVAVTMPERIEVRLLTPVGSDDAANSPVSGEVVSPATLSGARVEGRLVESRSSQRANGVSVMELEFATLRHQGKAMRFDGRVAEIRNSQGTPGVDDLGHELKGNNGVFRKGRKAATRIGAAIGGLFGGGKKKDEESSTTVVTASGPNIAFLPGSEFELEVAAWSQLEPTQTK